MVSGPFTPAMTGLVSVTSATSVFWQASVRATTRLATVIGLAWMPAESKPVAARPSNDSG